MIQREIDLILKGNVVEENDVLRKPKYISIVILVVSLYYLINLAVMLIIGALSDMSTLMKLKFLMDALIS